MATMISTGAHGSHGTKVPPGATFAHDKPLGETMEEKIRIKTENGQTLEVVVLNKRAERIEVVLGEGVHSVRCGLTPSRNGLAYVGSVMGREIIYERSREQVQADIERLNPNVRGPRR
jgi:hypothetical protein